MTRQVPPRGRQLFEYLLKHDLASLAYWYASTAEESTRAWERYMELHAPPDANSTVFRAAQNRAEMETLLQAFEAAW